MTPEQQRVYELTGLRMGQMQAIRHLESCRFMKRQSFYDRINAARDCVKAWDRMEASK